MIGVLLVLILFGGVFVISNLFLEPIDEPKSFFLLITSIILLLVCLVSRNGIRKLLDSLKSSIFFYGITTVCLLTTIHGLFQYVGIMPSFHRSFPITGAFDNPAGFAAVQAGMFPFVFALCCERKNGKFFFFYSAIVSLLCLVSVVLAGSRAGFLAICTAIIVVLAFTDKINSFFKKHSWFWLPIALIMVTMLVLIYLYKKDSADGRLFIWSRCFDMIKEKPLFGYGKYGFNGHYMSFQADYFRAHPDSPYVMIADNVIHPFNEYIKLTVNYGLVGLSVAILLLMMIVRRLLKSDKHTKVLGLSFVSSIFVMCQFSYPFQYNVLWLLIFMAIGPIIIKKGKQIMIPGYARIIVSVALLIGLAFSLKTMYYEMKWTEITKRCRKGRVLRMIPYYEGMEHVMRNNPLFFYNYAAELNYAERYDESLEFLSRCSNSWNDYNVQIMFCDNYVRIGQKDSALIACDQAYNMIPSRFEPLYREMIIYTMLSDTANAVRVAYEIIEKPIKVRSDKLNEMVSMAERVVSSYDN